MSEESVVTEPSQEGSTPEVEASPQPNLDHIPEHLREEYLAEGYGSEETTEEVDEQEEVEQVEDEPEEPLYELKIDGETLMVPQSKLIEMAQKGQASTKKFQEAARLQKEIAAEKKAVQAALQGDLGALFDLKIKSGHMTPDEARQWVIEKALAYADEAEMSPEERERAEMQRKLEEYERKEKEAEEQAKKAQFEQEKERYKEDFSKQIINAMETGGLDKDPITVRRVAAVLQSSIDPTSGGIQISVQDAVEYIKEQDRNEYLDYVKGLDPDKLEKVLGADTIKRLRNKDFSKLANPESPAKPSLSSSPKKSSQKKEYKSAKDFFESLGR